MGVRKVFTKVVARLMPLKMQWVQQGMLVTNRRAMALANRQDRMSTWNRWLCRVIEMFLPKLGRQAFLIALGTYVFSCPTLTTVIILETSTMTDSSTVTAAQLLCLLDSISVGVVILVFSRFMASIITWQATISACRQQEMPRLSGAARQGIRKDVNSKPLKTQKIFI